MQRPSAVALRRPVAAWRRRARALALAVAVLGTAAAAGLSTAGPRPFPSDPPRPAGAAEEGIRWQKLKPAQREALKPLQQEWPTIDAARKQKWVQIADRMPNMPPDERARVQARMGEWSRLTPAQRSEARLQYQEAKQVPLPDRRSRWEAYQALSPQEKSELAARAAAARGAPPPAADGARGATVPIRNGDRPPGTRNGEATFHAKSNIVPNPAYATPPRPVSPTVVQAAPGATTTLITRRPAPPPHQQTGMPKIAATPEFVNKTTLLPQRGPQGAAVRPVAGNEPAAAKR
jgi:hypothetical protein